ncbi:MAG: YcxB family protein [Lachnospiraceae bacterium]|nr:YcxB family protein [Lachnospiraceae bacterium]
MEVRAKSKFDYETIKELAHRSSYRLISPKVYWIVMIICTFIVFGTSFLFGVESDDIALMVVILICDAVSVYIYWGVPKIRYKALGKLQNLENEFIFGDETMKIINRSEEYTGQGEIKYSIIPKVMETPKYIFIYQDLRSVYIIDKSTVTNGTIEDIRAKLAQYVPQKKYIIKRK